MTGYGTGEVEAMLDLPASTLRFWEKEVPFLAPRKDVFGRRVYSPLDLCVLSRLKYLALDRKLGLKAACRAMETELMLGDHSLKADIIELKTTLFSLSAELKSLRANPFLNDAEKAPAREGMRDNDSNDEKPL
ncbi:MAG TPA: MerR family transcriptional regulator [Rectinemataceae bacterium]|nr:MerR family transcriptional regulator [Rectinemataceae bacterium]